MAAMRAIDMRSDRRVSHLWSDRGATEALGLVLMTPVMMAAAVALFWISRQVDTQAQVHTTVEAAAQAAALQRSPVAADTSARKIASEMLLRSDLCESLLVGVDLGGFGPGGQVSVEIVCKVSVSGLGAAALNQPTVISARATATIDRFKQMESTETNSLQGRG
jgi:hypothetical protein